MLLKKGMRIVFAGDSVTDDSRSRPEGEGRGNSLGLGYVHMTDSMLTGYLATHDFCLCIQLFHQCCIKRRSQGRPARHGKGDCPAVHPDPAGSVRAAADRNSHFLQMFRHSAEGTGRSGRHLRRAHSFSPHNRAQIFIRELRDKIRKKSLSLCNVRKSDSNVSGIRKLFRNSLRTSVRRNHRPRRHRLF